MDAQDFLFNCQPSSEISGHLYTPNIPDFYFQSQNADNFRNINITTLDIERRIDDELSASTYIFMLPQESETGRNCSGSIRFIQYCYEAVRRDGPPSEMIIFHLLIDTRMDDPPGIGFRLRAIQDTPCNAANDQDTVVCCSFADISSENLVIESNPFRFGIVTHSGEDAPQPLSFDERVLDSYHATANRVLSSVIFDGGFSIESLPSDTRTVGLPLFRFFIGIRAT